MTFRPIQMPPAAACAALRRRRRQLLARLSALRTCPDSAFDRQFRSMVAAVEAAFRHEEALLELLGDACAHPRRADHAIILCALHRSAARVEAGDLRRGREVAAALEAILGSLAAPAPGQRAASLPAGQAAH